MKVVNPQCKEWDSFDLQMRRVMGIDLSPDDVRKKAGSAAQQLIENRTKYEEVIQQVRDEHIYHFGESGKYGAQYILHSLQEKRLKQQGGTTK